MEERKCSNCKNFHQHYIKIYNGFSEFPKGHCINKRSLIDKNYVCEHFEYFDFAAAEKQNKNTRCRLVLEKIESLLEKVVEYIENDV